MSIVEQKSATESDKGYSFQQSPQQILQLPTGIHALGESARFDGTDPWLAYPCVDSVSYEIRVSIAKRIKLCTHRSNSIIRKSGIHTQSLSYMMTVSAEVRLMPRPPARVLKIKTNLSFSSLNALICRTRHPSDSVSRTHSKYSHT